jgi:hypothetical protein
MVENQSFAVSQHLLQTEAYTGVAIGVEIGGLSPGYKHSAPWYLQAAQAT